MTLASPAIAATVAVRVFINGPGTPGCAFQYPEESSVNVLRRTLIESRNGASLLHPSHIDLGNECGNARVTAPNESSRR